MQLQRTGLLLSARVVVRCMPHKATGTYKHKCLYTFIYSYQLNRSFVLYDGSHHFWRWTESWCRLSERNGNGSWCLLLLTLSSYTVCDEICMQDSIRHSRIYNRKRYMKVRKQHSEIVILSTGHPAQQPNNTTVVCQPSEGQRAAAYCHPP